MTENGPELSTPGQVAFWLEVVVDVAVLGMLGYMLFKGSY